jgi:3-(3-hydroxy-phenyl)propionate hydroxylase
MMREQLPIVIVGAGPVGLVTALALGRQGIPVLVLECETSLPLDLRASTLHCATLDLLDDLGVTERLLRVGYQVRYWQIRDRAAGVVAQWDLGLLQNDTRFPFRIACEQHKLAKIVLDMLSEVECVEVRLGCRFLKSVQKGDNVLVQYETVEDIQQVGASWLVGADGGKSAVRKDAGIEFEGFTWPEQFLGVSTDYDFEPSGFTYSAYISDPVEWVAVFKVPHDGPPGVWRAMFPVNPKLDAVEALSDEFVESRMQGFMPRAERYSIKYKNLYRVHQRVAKSFRKGRVMLVGDAAHVNNPVGALGLNGGLQDAANLAEKLGRVWSGAADDGLMDQYERQRRTTSVESIQADSIRNKRLLEETDPLVRTARLDEIRSIAADRRQAREYLLKSSMIASVRQSNAIP